VTLSKKSSKFGVCRHFETIFLLICQKKRFISISSKIKGTTFRFRMNVKSCGTYSEISATDTLILLSNDRKKINADIYVLLTLARNISAYF